MYYFTFLYLILLCVHLCPELSCLFHHPPPDILHPLNHHLGQDQHLASVKTSFVFAHSNTLEYVLSLSYEMSVPAHCSEH